MWCFLYCEYSVDVFGDPLPCGSSVVVCIPLTLAE